MKLKYIISALLITIFVFGYLFHKEEEKLIAKFEKERRVRNKAEKFNSSDLFQADATQKKIETLLSSFSIRESPYSDSSWYVHKYWSTFDQKRIALTAKINEKGEFSLVSQYYGKKRILHDRIFVKVGENLYDSSVVKIDVPIDHSPVVEVWETIELKEEKDLLIAKEISRKIDEPVYVRLWGKEGYEDIRLSEENKMAIRETLELAILLKS
ncbi:hypothetical protein [Flexithrix dorotheae]|uniref:hypothetical protein n=1 Tax=Flexithrix dorotheae TaxID=70993 RepID=UPI000367723F|nr:hypothetical protein [Flexithrix dorotheae]